jgi:integrase
MTEQQHSNEEKQPTKRGKRRPRKHGSGSVFRRPERKGKQWVAQIIVDDKPKQRYFHTEKEADEALNEMLYEQKRGTLITEKDQTVKQLIEHWLENVHRRTIRDSTYVEYRNMIKNHIYPAFEHTKLRDLTVQRLEAFYSQMEQKELSAGYIRNVHQVLHQALSYAVKNNLVARNVADYVTLPRLGRHQVQAMTIEQAQQFVAAARGHHLEALFTMAVLTGMREGELLALHWSDINFEQKYLQIRRTVRQISGRGAVEGEPKTASSNRKIALTSVLIDVLKQHRVRQLEVRLRAGNAWKEHHLVFCTSTGRHIYASSLRTTFRVLLRDIGFEPMRFHDLRHSAATLLLAMGIHVKVVQELLGHSNVMTTLNIYSHVLPSLQEDAMHKLSALFDDPQDKNDAGSVSQK